MYMTNQNTSAERVDQLVALDDQVTPLLYERTGGEFRHRSMLRSGINLIATGLQLDGERKTGDNLQSFLLSQLGRGGLTMYAFSAWPTYQNKALVLPPPPAAIDQPLNSLANQYGDVMRRTINIQGKRERNSAHAVHLATLALPYAAEYYPELDQAKIALYCWIHDILEAYTGDVPSHGLSREEDEKKSIDEAEALQLLVATYGKHWPEFVQLVSDYEHRANPEARFVKTFDKLDPSYTHFRNSGQQLRDYYHHKSPESFLAKVAEDTLRIQPYGNEFPQVMEDRLELTQRIIKVTRWAAS
jgi:5'-deoxynucleotidase YfbR-like HD superfamily hydrolase